MLTEGFLATLVILACVAGLGLGIPGPEGGILTGPEAYEFRYASWNSALGPMIAAYVDGSANFLRAMGLPAGVSVALMGVLVASFAGTTLDTACRLHRYVIQELAGTFVNVGSETVEGGFTMNPLVWLTNKHGATIFAVILATLIAALPVPGTPVTFAQAVSGNLPEAYVSSAVDLPEAAMAGGLAGAGWWLSTFAGKGGLILWPLFGATNQLLAGLAFLVISFYLWRRKVPVWFIVIPMLFMLVMPAWAMWWQLGEWLNPAALADGTPSPRNWVVIIIGAATLALEGWMIVEAALLWPRVKGVLEERLPPLSRRPVTADGAAKA